MLGHKVIRGLCANQWFFWYGGNKKRVAAYALQTNTIEGVIVSGKNIEFPEYSQFDSWDVNINFKPTIAIYASGKDELPSKDGNLPG